MNIEQFSSIRQAEEMIKAIDAEPDAIRYTIFLNDEIIGSFGINEINKHENTIEIGYELAKEHWRKGIMTELLNQFLILLQTNLNFSGVYAKVLPENIASIQLLEKVGFKAVEETEEWDLAIQSMSKILIFKHFFEKIKIC
ncbi:hypothetical protein MFLO_12903 [Listeria floridensis FSL S10-1187]|uniref:N-acetyltransferase domain-containing protein n=1 Tax=Listeria floridensis FSL S10-1187 TaxID=1265817 RepID=A0ABP3AXV6_9LIST|nr:hypothetical protein MFLO_12903 [Listeria floridensis FSL S10-1187]